MRRLFFLLLFFLFVDVAYAQQPSYSTSNKEAIGHFALANRSLDDRLYDDAIAELQKAIEADGKFIESYALIVDVYRQKRDNKNAIEAYRKVLTLNPEFGRAIYIKLGEAEVSEAKYADAQQHLEKYLTYPNITEQNIAFAKKLIEDCKFSVQAMQHPVQFKPVSM